MKEFLMRLTSRKFWLAVGTFIVFVMNDQYTEAMGVVLAYIGVEGYKDATSGSSSTHFIEKITGSHNVSDDDGHTNEIITGRLAHPDEDPDEK